MRKPNKALMPIMKTLFFSLVLLTTFSALSNDSMPLNLIYEPLQPLVAPTHLNKEKVALGKKLFNESLLSLGDNMSCSSCHLLQDNGADFFTKSKGRNGQSLNTNTLTVFNSSLNHRQFWDGRAATLEEQIDFVVNSNKEFANSWPEIIQRLQQSKKYVIAFNKSYTDGINADNIRNAISTFERSLITVNSRFDQYLLGDLNAITAKEKKGYRLFKSYGCVACHQGSNVGGNMFMKFGLFGDYYAKQEHSDSANMGRYNITKKAEDRYVFRVPSLRLVTLTAPYFHDGSIETLREAIEIMAKYQLGRKMRKEHITDIIAFLKTLPGEHLGKPLRNTKPK